MKRSLFKFTANDKALNETHLVFASSLHAAEECLNAHTAYTVKAPSILSHLNLRKTINLKELGMFFKHFHRFIRTGAPVIDSIKICAHIAREPFLKGILSEISHKMRTQGMGMGDIIAHDYPGIFDPSIVAIIRSAEVSGKVDEVFDTLSRRVEGSHKLSKQIRSALAYPTCMLLFALASVAGMLLFVIPNFANAFSSMDIEMPALTALFMGLSDILANQSWLLIALVGFLFFTFSWINKHKNSQLVQGMASKIPFLSGLLSDLSLFNGFNTLALLIRSGTDLIESHKLAAQAASLPTHKHYFSTLEAKIRSGISLSAAYLEAAHLIGKKGREIALIVRVGDSSGTLPEVLQDLANGLEEDANLKAIAFPKMIQPFFMVFLFGIIGLMAAAIYLPQIQMIIQTIQK